MNIIKNISHKVKHPLNYSLFTIITFNLFLWKQPFII